jgi:hypothetical protein
MHDASNHRALWIQTTGESALEFIGEPGLAKCSIMVLINPIEGFLEARGEIALGGGNTVSKHSRASAFILIIVRSYPGRKK